MTEALLGLDVGGGSCRATLLHPDSRATATAVRKLVVVPVPGSGGMAFDVDLDAIWESLCSATREVLDRSHTRPDEVRGIAATAMRLGTVLLGDDGVVLHAVPNRDARAVGPGLQLAAQHGEALASLTGRWPLPIFAAARLQQIAANDPELLARVRSVLSISDWVTWRLCGEAASEPSQAGETLLFDLRTREWAIEWIERLGLPADPFPAIRSPGDVAGALSAEAAEALGLSSGMTVAVGGADTQCALLASGSVRNGDATIVAGTTAPVQQVVDSALIDPTHRLWSGHHVVGGRHVVESNAGPAGEVLSWFAKVFYPDDPQPEARLFGEAARSEPAARGLLSAFGAQVFDATKMVLPVGTLTLNHLSSMDDAMPRHHVVRAFVEGLAYAARANLEQIVDFTGLQPDAVRLTGGLSRSRSFKQLLADTLDLPVLATRTPEASSLGASLLAAVGAGLAPDAETASEWLTADRFEPRSSGSTAYDAWNALRKLGAESQATASALATTAVLAAVAVPEVASVDAPRPRVLISADFDAASLDELRTFAEVEYAPFREKMRLLSGDLLVKELADFDVFVTEIDLLDAAALARLPRLRVVGACRGDAVNVDVAACSAYGIPVVNAPGRNADAVADLTIAFLLMLARKLQAASAFLRTGDIEAGDMGKMGQAFGTLRGRELWGKTIGLVGLGAVGRAVAKRLRGFGARILVADPFIDAETAALSGAEHVALDELLATSDFVSLHAAVVDATRQMIDADAIAKMKPGACLINTARAALTDEDAIAEGLASGKLAGAAFDTFSVEPPGSDHPLLQFQQVIATPHVGGNTEDVAAHQGRIMVAELRRMLDGNPPLHALDPSALAGFDLRAPRRAVDSPALAKLADGPAPAVTDLQKKPAKEKPADRDVPKA